MKYVFMVEDEQGDLVDIVVYCSAFCFEQDLGISATGYAWPDSLECNHDIYCETCEELIEEGLYSD